MKRNIIYAILMIAPTLCMAQSELLTLEACQQMALQNNVEIARSQAQVEQMGYDVKSYKSNYYPRLNLMAYDMYSTAHGDLTITGGHLPIYTLNPATGTYVPNVTPNADGSYTLNQYADFPDQKMEYKVKNVFMGGLMLTQPIYMGGKITTAYNMSLIGREMAELNVSLTKDEILVKTGEAYFLAVKAKEMIEVAKKYKTLLEELSRTVDNAVKNGLKTRNDKMKVQVKLNEAELNLTKAENAYRLARMNLCHYIGRPLTSDIEVASQDYTNETSFHPNINKTINITSRQEYELLNKKVELAEKQIALTRSDYLPNVVLTGGVMYANGAELAGKKLIDGASASVGIGVKIPLLTFGENTNKIRSAKSKQVIARLEQEDLNEKMMLEQQQALNNVEEAEKIVTFTTSALTQAEENMRLSKQQYEVGTETLSDHLEAQALWQNCYASKIDAICQYQLAWLKYQKSKGEIGR